jgi:hypothetical protein
MRSSSGEVSLWLNGTKELTTAIVTGAVDPPGDLYIGRHSASASQDFNGVIDEVRIHNRGLDPSEFNLLPAGAPSALMGAWPSLDDILIKPNPVRAAPGVLYAEGLNIAYIAVEIYDLAGSRVFASGWQAGDTLEWPLRNEDGELLANGVYLYIIRVRGIHGEERRGKVKKLVILR